jgi:thiosulfate dehydrogenase [quinone] large subunit
MNRPENHQQLEEAILKARLVNPKGDVTIPEPPLAHLLFSTTRLAWLWAIVRIYLGYQWVEAGWHKITGGGWIDGGTALKGFWTKAAAIPAAPAKPAITYDWYRAFIQIMLDNGWYSWFASLVAFGEFLVGAALIVGAFVGIAAFFGAVLNWNFLMAGAASTNPVLLMLGIVLVLAWKVAGWYGLDRFLLPLIGTPWTWKREEPLPLRPAPSPTTSAPAVIEGRL